MTPIPVTPKTSRVARNIVWFESPEKSLADPIRFMTYALPEDMRVIREYVSDDDIRQALDNAPAGIIDPRSWAYWNSKMGRYPPPPLPVRQFGVTSRAQVPVTGRDGQTSGAKPVQESGPSEQRQLGRMAWSQVREQESSKLDLEEIRRLAGEEWRAKYGPKDKD